MLPVPVGSDVTIGWSGIAAPEHTVPTISAFRIGKLEVDWALWTNVRDWALANGYCFANPGMMGGGSGSKTAAHPVTSISHRDMLVWCNALSRRSGLTVAYYTESDLSTEYHDAADGNAGLVKVGGSGANDCVDWKATGYRLPTETEWEYAARWTATGLSSGMWVSGASAASMDDDYAWHAGNSAGQTAAGGLKLANALGLRDMSGNVAEFCWDWFADYAVTPPFTDADSRGVASGSWRVVRGGSFLTIAPLETSRRANMEPTTDVTDNAVGFRVVRSGAP
jgi:formylglycine-generating enzyme required for sulfatase activity